MSDMLTIAEIEGCFIPQLTVSSTPLAVIEWQLYD
jgi:hypothetical protein